MNKYVSIFSLIFLQACAQEPYFGKLDYLGQFASRLSEVSGIDKDLNGNLWVIEDNGNKDKIYRIGSSANTIKELKIEDAKNKDWEDLAIAKDGTFYIGDFGNNGNYRDDLVIYRIPPSQLDKKTPKADEIKFSYPEQKDFPPKKSERLFDCEGFFHWNGYLYLFTKNRTRPYSGKTLAYRVPDKEGKYEAELLGEFTLCKNPDNCSVTGSDISEDGKTIALIGYGFIYLLTDFNLSDFSQPNITTIDLGYKSQIESICFLDQTTLLIADEQSKTKGRNLYSYSLSKQ